MPGSSPAASDAALIERCLQKDNAAWDEIMARYRRRVFHIAYKFTGKHDQAEDLSRTAEELAAEEDVISQALWRTVRARVLARRGEHESARGHAEEAIELLRPTGELVREGDAIARPGMLLYHSGTRTIELMRGRLPEAIDGARIVELRVQLLNPGSAGEGAFAEVSAETVAH